MAYGFDDMGNMEFRQDTYRNLKENYFIYDNLNRLQTIEYHVNGIHQLYNDRHMEYDNAGGVGNISSITGTGSGFVYGENAGPHALTSVNIPEHGWRPGPQEINYTAFNKVSSITDTLEGGRIIPYEILYGMDNQRRKSIFKDSGQVVRTKHYFGDYEKINENSSVKNYHYISSPTGLCAIFVTDDQSGQSQLRHTYSDHLGSLVYMVNADNSNDYKEYSLDAWGNPRDAGDWTQVATENLFAGRGFTGHSLSRLSGKHLEEFALIDMNGRIYDPMLGRFFSPDPYVQLPGYAGSYNRYSYCIKNPLIYTDPDGEFFFLAVGIGALIGAYIGGSAAEGWQMNPTKKEGTTTYSYDPAEKPGDLASANYPGGSVSYIYDSYSRPQSKTITINSTNYTTSFTYDNRSRPETYTYPSGFAVKNIYNTFGYLSQVRRNDNNALIWECESVNVFGRITQF